MPDEKILWKEINYETKFVNLCAKEGWLCEKFIVPGKRGVPDRIITADRGYICFVEMKTPGGRLHPLQKLDHQERRKRGAHVYVVASMDEALQTIEDIKYEISRR